MAQTITFNILIEDLRAKLADLSFVTFDQRAIEQALRDTMREMNQVASHTKAGTITLAATGREISISTLAQPAHPVEVWLPYTAAAPEDPPNLRTWRQLTGTTIYIVAGDPPTSGQIMRVFYTTPHTINGLDGASETTFDDTAIAALLAGAAAEVCNARRREIIEHTQTNPDTLRRFEELYNDWRGRLNNWFVNARRRPAGGFIELT